MALSSTVRTFEIELADVDRGVYDSLALKVAQHPSESLPYLVTRVVAYALEHTEGLAFTTGLSTADEPALWVRDLTDRLVAWIDIGTPTAARLHKASKAADRVAVYCHKAPEPWLRQLAGEKVHGTEHIALYSLDPRLVDAIGATIERRNRWQLTRTEGTVFLEGDAGSFELPVTPMPWPEP
jgi:uncharacterized protein YaeQ